MNKFYLSSVKITEFSSKPSTAIRLLLMVLFFCLFGNQMSAQTCNGSSGTVFSNTATMCVGTSQTFWSDGWSGSSAFWTSSNPAVLTAVKNSSDQNATVTAIASGTADVIYTYKESGCPDKVSKKTITVGYSVSADQFICTGSSLASNITVASASGTIQWQRADNAAFTTNVTNIGSNSTTLTIGQVGTLTATKYFRAVVTGGACGNGTSAIVTVTANTVPSMPTVGTTTQPNCTTATGSVILSGLPATGTWTVTRSPGGVTTSGTGTSTTISGLAVGTYTFTVTNASTCTSSATGNVVINAVVTNTWNGTWDNGTPPTTNGTQNLVFNAGFSSTTDLSGCSCTVNSGAVTINSGNTLTITNGVTVSGGSLTFNNAASLLQTNATAVNSGNITYTRSMNSTTVRSSDYTYWSSPVANQTLNISSNYASGMFYSYDDFATPEGWKKETIATIMQFGKGYIIRGSQSNVTTPPGLINATFFGIPNNGSKTIAIGSTGTSNLLGNPYPSAIDADTFLAANSTLIEGTIYFWTHNTAIQLASNITNGTAGTGALAYTSDDYASYNGTGGVAVSGGVIPTGKIAAGQAFFTTSKAIGGTVTYTNAMRLVGTLVADGTGVNQQFFKTKNTDKTINAIEKNRIWLNLSNKQGAFKQTLVGYITDATNDYDSRFDGESFDGNEFVDFYSVNNDENLVIQGRALPFNENDIVPLGFRSTINGNFTINIDQADGLLTNQDVFIEDKLTNTVTNLKTGIYTFNTVEGTFNDRFVLRYTDKTLGTTDFDAQANTVLVSIKNKQIKLNSFAETIDRVTIYDLQGRQIYQKDKVNSNEFLITDFVSNHETFIVKTSLQNGKTVREKIMY